MDVTAKIDQKFFATWPKPKDKGGNDAATQGGYKFVSDDENSCTIVAATAEELDAFNATASDADKIPADLYETTGKVATSLKVSATVVRIKTDADLGDGVKEIEGTLAVSVTSGEATAFGEAKATAPADNEETVG